MSDKELKLKIIKAGRKAVQELIEVANEKIVTGDEDDLAADKLKNAAATKKVAIFDAFEILERIELEEANIKSGESGPDKLDSTEGFAERRSRGN